MATHSSILAWRILWTEEPDRQQSIASHRVGRPSAHRVRGRRTCPCSCSQTILGAQLLQRCSSGGDSEQRHFGSVTKHLHRLWEPFLLGFPPALQAEMPHSQPSPAPSRSRVTLRRETPPGQKGTIPFLGFRCEMSVGYLSPQF